jgi:hypothetical protein
MKKIYYTIFVIYFILIFNNTCFASYHETNLTGTELNQEAIENIEYQKYNFKEKGKEGLLKNALSETEDEEGGFIIKNFINYKKYHFWILIISLISILIILTRLSNKLKKMEQDYKNKRIVIIKNKTK